MLTEAYDLVRKAAGSFRFQQLTLQFLSVRCLLDDVSKTKEMLVALCLIYPVMSPTLSSGILMSSDKIR